MALNQNLESLYIEEIVAERDKAFSVQHNVQTAV
jgi:hypothetical protein